jgi:negative regulator of flagellin synthesis FlgM
MRVEQSKSNGVSSAETGGAKQTGRAAAPQNAKKADKSEKASSSETDRAHRQGARTEISSKGKEFATARAVATQTPDVRDDRIAELKKKISEGNYKVNADAVADRMIDDHLKMSGMG